MIDPDDLMILKTSPQQKFIMEEFHKMIQERIRTESMAAMTYICTPQDFITINQRDKNSKYFKGFEPSLIIVDDLYIEKDIVEFIKQNIKSEHLWKPVIANLLDFKNQSLIKEIKNQSQKRSNQNGVQDAKTFADSITLMNASLVEMSKSFNLLTKMIKDSKYHVPKFTF